MSSLSQLFVENKIEENRSGGWDLMLFVPWSSYQASLHLSTEVATGKPSSLLNRWGISGRKGLSRKEASLFYCFFVFFFRWTSLTSLNFGSFSCKCICGRCCAAYKRLIIGRFLVSLKYSYSSEWLNLVV